MKFPCRFLCEASHPAVRRQKALSAWGLNSAFLISLPPFTPSVRRERLVYPYIVKRGHSYTPFGPSMAIGRNSHSACLHRTVCHPASLSRARARGSMGSYPAPNLSSCKNGPGACGGRLFRDGKPEKPEKPF